MGTKMSKFISLNEACGLLGIRDIDIFDYLKKGLQIYSKFGNLYLCPGKFHRYLRLQTKKNYILKPSEVAKYLPDGSEPEGNILPEPNTFEDEEEAKSKALDTIPEKLKRKFLKIENEMSKIIKDDPTLTSWKHFDKESYSDGDIEDLLSEIKNDCLFSIKEVAAYKDHIKKGDVDQGTEYRLINMFSEAEPEVEKLYSVVREKFKASSEDSADLIQEIVLYEFNKDRDYYKVVNEEYLSDIKIYNYSDGQRKRDFIGRLLQKISLEKRLGLYDYEKLYDLYLKFKRGQLISTEI